MHSCSVQDLIGIDVSDSGDQMLIEERRLHRPLRSSSDSAHVVGGEFVDDRIDTEAVEFRKHGWPLLRIECNDLTEGSGIDETQLCRKPNVGTDFRRGTQRQYDMAMRWPRIVRSGDQDLTAHPQVNHQFVSRIESEKKVLSSPARIDRPSAGQALCEFLARCASHSSLSANLDTFDSATDECDLETSAYGLDFGQFRHGPCRHRALRAQKERETMLPGRLTSWSSLPHARGLRR